MAANNSANMNIEEWIKPILLKQGVQDFTFVVSGSSEKGDGYIGDITFVEVTGKSKSNEEKNFSFVIKSGKESKKLREVIPIRAAFNNEMLFYNEVLPAFEKFQKEKGVKEPFNNAAKCFGSLMLDEMEVLVLDNLKKKGYRLHDRREPMNKEHIRAVMKIYGKLHAISFALRDQNPELFKKLSGNFVDVFKVSGSLKPPEDFKPYQPIIDAAKEINDTSVIEKANSLHIKAKNWADVTDPTDPYAVILHGDCWNNNFMFKYEDNQYKTPSEICLLDFQLSKLASPVYDLSYFLFTCLSEEDTHNFDEINNLYYESLSKSLTEMGGDPKKMFPYEELMNQWKVFSIFGLVMLPGIARICVSDKDEVPDLAASADSDDMDDLFVGQSRNNEEYSKRTLPIIRLAASRGFADY